MYTLLNRVAVWRSLVDGDQCKIKCIIIIIIIIIIRVVIQCVVNIVSYLLYDIVDPRIQEGLSEH